jgi:hypothetical protein
MNTLREKYLARLTNCHLRRKYGITLEDFSNRLQKQSGVCAICGGLNKDRKLAVDHDHRTKQIRGLLCSSCNLGIGRFKDSPELLIKAAQYLRSTFQ